VSVSAEQYVRRVIVSVARQTGRSAAVVAQESYAVTLWTYYESTLIDEELQTQRLGAHGFGGYDGGGVSFAKRFTEVGNAVYAAGGNVVWYDRVDTRAYGTIDECTCERQTRNTGREEWLM
jgi:hypothetical protein